VISEGALRTAGWYDPGARRAGECLALLRWLEAEGLTLAVVDDVRRFSDQDVEAAKGLRLVADGFGEEAARREGDRSAVTVRMPVGFVDLVGFTAHTRSLSAPALAVLVRGFAARAHELVGAHGGRVVKADR
jgi:class 3 adenylate cyclase